jgi:hypothetical protein
MKKPFILLIGVGYVLSCQKEESTPNKGLDWFGTHDNAVYNYVLISGNQVTNKSDTNDYQISIAAAFIDSNTNKITGVHNLSINDRDILPGVDSTYNFGYNNTPFFQEGLSLFGTNINIRIHGKNQDDTVSKTVYLPKKIVKLVSDFPEVVDLAKSLTLQWIPDNQNSWGKVIVQIYYYPNLSLARDSSLPKDVKSLNYTTVDNGSFVVPPPDLMRFPLNSFIGISIARGTQNIALLPISLKRVYFFSSSSASTVPIQVVMTQSQ